jgi:sec-independent protein translocase protein TatC
VARRLNLVNLNDVATLVVKFKKGILYISLYALIVSVLVFPLTNRIIMRMRGDLLHGQYILIQTQPLELMMLELKLSFIIGILATLPILFFYGYKFLKGRKLGDRFRISKLKLALAVVVGAGLFILGCLYSYLLMLPMVFQYLMQSATDVGVANHWRVSDFINFAIMTTFVFGLVFELPLIMTVLARANLIPIEIFKKYRRHMYVVILVVAALVTSPDVLTQIMVGVPLILFYEISLFSMRFTVPKRNIDATNT